MSDPNYYYYPINDSTPTPNTTYTFGYPINDTPNIGGASHYVTARDLFQEVNDLKIRVAEMALQLQEALQILRDDRIAALALAALEDLADG